MLNQAKPSKPAIAAETPPPARAAFGKGAGKSTTPKENPHAALPRRALFK